MRVLFLDIDGVLAPKPTPQPRPLTPKRSPQFPSRSPAISRPAQPSTPRIIQPACVACLKQILAKTGAIIVISSSWRLSGDMRPVLRKAGVVGDFHEDWRTDDGPGTRGDQIQRWLSQHGAPAFVVLDDWLPELAKVAGRTVQTDYRAGLRLPEMEAAVKILSSPMP